MSAGERPVTPGWPGGTSYSRPVTLAEIRQQLAQPLQLPGKVWQLTKEMAGIGYPAGEARAGALTVGIDATPLVGARTGVGRYVERVSSTMAGFPDAPDQVWTLFSRRLPLSAEPPPHTRLAPRAVPSRFLQPLWRRFDAPKVEYLTGPLDVFHGGNYVMPPTRQAATAVTVHDLTFRFFPHTVHPAMMPVLARLPDLISGYDAVLTVSEAVADEIAAELSVPRDRIVVAPNGVDASWSSAGPLDTAARDRLGVPERYFVFVGTQEPRKNLRVLLDAHRAARLNDAELPDLVLAGGAGWGEDIEAIPGVRTVGYLHDPEVQGLMSGAVAICAPSLYEGFGLPVLEGLACGRRVLASDIAAHREVARGQAELLPVDDPDAWADAMSAAASSGEPDDTTVAARREVAAGFTWNRSARIHLDTYRLLAKR